MKSLIIYESIHHGNTDKVARAMAESIGARLAKPALVDVSVLERYDLIGFGSGIYFWRHHASLLRLAELMPTLAGRKVFIFSTRGAPLFLGDYHGALRRRLTEKGCSVAGEFACRGFDTVGPLRFIGGIARKHPNGRDLARARAFAERMAAGVPGSVPAGRRPR